MLVLSSALVLGALGCTTDTGSATSTGEPPSPASHNGHPQDPQERRYRVDDHRSKITAHVGVGGMLAALGHDHTVELGGLTGEVWFQEDRIEQASLHIVAEASGAAEVDEAFSPKARDKINRAIREDALESARYPAIEFKSTKISLKEAGAGSYQADVEGNLTLHGVTHPIAIPARVELSQNSLRATGEFTVRHSDYGIKRISAGAGTVKAKEEIRLSFVILALPGSAAARE